ncbi:MAG: hypothetical protein B1H13_13835 [Desulfobacteraceae bacterium 4484_190.3]|nr:MAG: hypothetical protein B1H13_13835 [Desulfobacteraceae bacterium 4484_190.3]
MESDTKEKTVEVRVFGDLRRHLEERPVHPGDRIAFLPYGTPGPYRAFLGIWREGKKAETKRKNEEETISGRK